MKTYILRKPRSVEPASAPATPTQPDTARRATRAQPPCTNASAPPQPLAPEPPVPAATAAALLGAPAAPGTGPALFIGLDVHSESIAVSLAPSDSTEVRRYGLIGGTHDDVLKLAKKLASAHPGLTLRFCYEAGPHGYPLCRCLRAHGHDCILVAPSKIPRQPGDRVKTNRRDADKAEP